MDEMIPYDSVRGGSGIFADYDDWVQAHPVLNWSLAFVLLIITIIVIEKVRKK